MPEFFKAGFAEAIISPQVGVRMGGFASRVKPSVGIHDDLMARSLALGMDEESAIMVSCDLLALDDEMVKAIRETIETETGIAGDRVLLAATHTHSGPDIVIPFQEKESGDWIEVVTLQVARCAMKAFNSRADASVSSGIGEAHIGFNRRRKDGPVDASLCLLRVDGSSGNLSVALMNYACHAVVLGPANLYISGDYPGFAVKNLEKHVEARGRNLKALFFNGACGDINPVTCKGYACPGTFEDAEKLGSVLAAETLEIYERLEPQKPERFGTVSRTVDLPIRELPSLEDAKDALKRAEAQASSPLDADLIYARERHLLASKGLEGSVKGEIQALAIDDTALVTLPGEAVVSLGLAIKHSSPFGKTFVLGYGNGYVGYICSKDDFEIGGYETKLARWSFLKPEAYQTLFETAVKAMRELED